MKDKEMESEELAKIIYSSYQDCVEAIKILKKLASRLRPLVNNEMSKVLERIERVSVSELYGEEFVRPEVKIVNKEELDELSSSAFKLGGIENVGNL